MALAHQRVREQAMAVQVIRSLLDGFRVSIGGETAVVTREPIEPLACETAQVGARRKQIEDRTVGARGERQVTAGFECFA